MATLEQHDASSRRMRMGALRRGLVAYHSGEQQRAADLVREVLPAGPSTEPGGRAINTLLAYQRLGAMLALDSGDPAAARSWPDAHDRFLAWSGAVPGRAEGQTCWAAYFRANNDLQGAMRHATQALTLAERPRQPLALLAARRTLGELLTQLGRHAEADEHFGAALTLADACAARFEHALTLPHAAAVVTHGASVRSLAHLPTVLHW